MVCANRRGFIARRSRRPAAVEAAGRAWLAWTLCRAGAQRDMTCQVQARGCGPPLTKDGRTRITRLHLDADFDRLWRGLRPIVADWNMSQAPHGPRDHRRAGQRVRLREAVRISIFRCSRCEGARASVLAMSRPMAPVPSSLRHRRFMGWRVRTRPGLHQVGIADGRASS